MCGPPFLSQGDPADSALEVFWCFRAQSSAAARRESFAPRPSRRFRPQFSTAGKSRGRVKTLPARAAWVVRRTACRGKRRAYCARKETTARRLNVSPPWTGWRWRWRGISSRRAAVAWPASRKLPSACLRSFLNLPKDIAAPLTVMRDDFRGPASTGR